ncbi:hypothetical protein BP6252_03778 [Coleophoma cylindrospora]|uniref:SET domain-containing protein n=1 Tax=Coleophoma cylindrospora TaxID=1849047 RepID=A0A3D8S8J5_9HELO|nr:hypothetical protein BP6252_03778 [Coleophoma cylindrospora]
MSSQLQIHDLTTPTILSILPNPPSNTRIVILIDDDDMEDQQSKLTPDEMIEALVSRPASLPATMPPLGRDGAFMLQLFMTQSKMKAAKQKADEAEALRPQYETFEYDLTHPNRDILYKQVNIPGRGKGLVAKEVIARGTMIIMDLPILRLKTAPCDNSYTTDEGEKAYFAENQEIAKQVKEMGKHEQRTFLSLHKYDKSKKAPFIGIVNANALPVEPTGVAVFPEISKINHACAPTAEYSFNTTTGEARVYAVEHIEQDQEITIDYTLYRWDHELRRTRLTNCHGFQCKCDYICGTTDAGLQAHKKMWEHFASLDHYLVPETVGFMLKFGEEAMNNMFTRKNMCQMMNIWDSRAAGTFFHAWQICLAHGDLQRAQCFGVRALVNFRDCLGEEHPTFKIMQQRLKEYASEAVFKKDTYWKGTTPEDENIDTSLLTAKEFHDWLWHPGLLKLMLTPDDAPGATLAWLTVANIPWRHNHPEITDADFDFFHLLHTGKDETGENDLEGSTARSYSPRPASTVEGSEATFIDGENEEERLAEDLAGLGVSGGGDEDKAVGSAAHGGAIHPVQTEKDLESQVTAREDGNIAVADTKLGKLMAEGDSEGAGLPVNDNE